MDPVATSDPVSAAPRGVHACYLLKSTIGDSTYNGYTNDLTHRLRQHNGELVGGAKATTRLLRAGGTWEVIAVITGDDAFTYKRALSLEWRIRYPTGRRPRPRMYQGACGRMAGMALAMAHPKFADLTLVAHAKPEYTHYFFLAGGGGGAQQHSVDSGEH